MRAWDAALQVLLVMGIALQGTIPAIMWRLGHSDRYDDDPARLRDVAPEDWLVVVRDPHDAFRAHHVLERHPLEFLDDERPVPPAG